MWGAFNNARLTTLGGRGGAVKSEGGGGGVQPAGGQGATGGGGGVYNLLGSRGQRGLRRTNSLHSKGNRGDILVVVQRTPGGQSTSWGRKGQHDSGTLLISIEINSLEMNTLFETKINDEQIHAVLFLCIFVRLTRQLSVRKK